MVTEVSFPCLRWSTAMMLAFLVDPLSRSISLQYCAAVREMYTPSTHQVDWAQHFPSWIPEKNHASGQVSQIQDQQLARNPGEISSKGVRTICRWQEREISSPFPWGEPRAAPTEEFADAVDNDHYTGTSKQTKQLRETHFMKCDCYLSTKEAQEGWQENLQSASRWMRFCSK